MHIAKINSYEITQKNDVPRWASTQEYWVDEKPQRMPPKGKVQTGEKKEWTKGGLTQTIKNTRVASSTFCFSVKKICELHEMLSHSALAFVRTSEMMFKDRLSNRS